MKKKKINWTMVIIFISCISFFILNKGLQTADDRIYKNAFYNIDTYFDWISEFYFTWSGRITVTSFINFFTNMPIIFFKIVNTIAFGGTIYLMYSILNILFGPIKKYTKNILLVTIVSLIYFIDMHVINSGSLWLSGALNYFWPLASLFVSIIPFISKLKGREIKNKNYIFFILANCISAMVEQTALVLIVFGIITFFICKLENKKIDKLLVIHYIIILIFSMIVLVAPGNKIRSISEELKWYNNFSMLSTSDKIVQGFTNFVNHMINGNIILFSYLIIQIVCLKLKKDWKNINNILTCSILIIYLICSIFLKKYDIFNFGKLNIYDFYEIENIFKLILNGIVFAILGIEILYIFEDYKNGLIISCLYFASICSALSLSFSPTIFASGNRIFILTDFLLVLINSSLSLKLLKEYKNSRNIIFFVYITVLLSYFNYLNLYLTGTNKILY